MFDKAVKHFYYLVFLFSSMNAQVPDNYEIVGHKAFIKLYPKESVISVSDTISFRFKENILSEISLILNPLLKIETIYSEGRPLKYKQQREVLKISASFKKNAEIVLNYNGIFQRRTEFSELSESNALLHENEIFPLGTKSYKFIRLTVQAANGWSVIAIGELINQSTENDSTTFTYQSDQLVQTLGWICGGNFSVRSKISNRYSFSTYLFHEDSAYSDRIISQLEKTISTYSENFSHYRFSKLAIVEVEDWVAGRAVLAAAFPSVILVKKQAFQTGDSFNNVNTILPHEVAHQWWPLTVFLNEADNALLSEGLCEYSSILFSEWSSEKLARDSLKNSPLLRSLLSRSAKGKDLPLRRKADLRSMPTHYLKAAYVHNMLRLIVGDSIYKLVLREFATKRALQISNSEDFQKIAENISHTNLDWFFKQWSEQTGIPKIKIYAVKTSERGEHWFTEGRVRLVAYEKRFTTPVEVGLITEEGVLKKTFWLGFDSLNVYRNEITFNFTSQLKPTSMILDPDGNILKHQKLPVKLSDLRDPADGVMMVGTAAGNPRYTKLLELAKRDSAEMDKAGWYLKIIQDTSATLGDLQNERVFVYGNITENIVADKIAPKFPKQPNKNSITIENKTYSDSLAIIQTIDNPYLSSGLMCWIVPLTDAASPHLMPYDASYVILNEKEIITKGVWEVKDDDLVVDIK
ncbi:MAG: M1 family aminopeptidase [Bacteroidota bacterium]|nr:M1 family aminopeptidase [Bacteroidota bacterium]